MAEYSVTDKAKRVAFLTYLMKFLESRKRLSEYDCDVDKHSRAKKLAKKWICFSLEKKVKSLSLDLKTIYRNHYYLRGIAFCATTLVDLTISDCEITNCSFQLPALKFLFLFVVCIVDDDFKDLIVGCPRIEKLRVLDTRKLHIIVVSNPELKFFGVNLPCSDGKIRIESTNLDSLEFISFMLDFCEVEITSTTTVRELTLRRAYHEETLMHFIKKFPLLEKLEIDDCNISSEAEINPMPTVRNLTLHNINEKNTTWMNFIDKFLLLEKLEINDCNILSDAEIDPMPMVRNLTLCNIYEEDTTWMNFTDKFPLLEKLIIDDCGKLQNLHLSQPNLASLVLRDCIVEEKVRINSPKLKSLEFKGCLTKFEGIEDLQELEFVLLYLDPVRLSKYWYRWFRYILKSCARYKHLSVICNSKQVIINPTYVRHILPVNDIEHLELEIKTRHGTFEEVTDDFISILPDLKTLSLTLGSTRKFFEFPRNKKLF